MKTKFFTLLLAVAASIGTMFADEVKIGDLYYNLDDGNQTAEVTSSPDKYSGSIVIPGSVSYNATTYSVTSIGQSAFKGCSGLTSLTIGNSVTSIGDGAFVSCSGLTSITIGKSVTSIGYFAFNGCTGLTSVIWNVEDYNDLTSDKTPFYWRGQGYDLRNQITSFIFGNDVKRIPAYLCYEMKQLASITIGNSVTSIGDYAFNGCSSLPVIDNIRYADTYLLEVVDKSLSSYTIKEGTKWIHRDAFSGCNSLTSLTIPNSVTSIGGSAFKGCTGLTSITIGESVTSIGNSAFKGCTGLTSIEIPNSVTSIRDYAFAWCAGLSSVTIPNSVTSIGSYAFEGCTGLTSVTIGSGVTSIGYLAFLDCTGLAKVTLNSSSIVSKEYSSRSNLKNIFGTQVEEYILGESVTNIGNFAFYENSNLTSVTIGSSVTNIGEQAFYNCTKIQKIYNHGQFPANVYSTAFDGVNKFSSTLYVPQNSIDMYKNAAVWRDFYYIEPLESVEAIEDVVDNNGATEGKTKLLRDGQIYVLRGEKVYTLQGTEVR